MSSEQTIFLVKMFKVELIFSLCENIHFCLM